ncbi:MAG TPA: ATPase, partial [Mycobacterium sp.]|nr:ATPase [Mycobacterium sp.]
PPLPTDYELPPMPEPAKPKGPAMWEEVLKNPTVKSGINTAIREAVKGIFGTGRRRK